MGEDFCRKATQYAGKKTAQTVRNGYENNF